MKLIYMGTPEFAVPPLKALLESGHEILAVVSQPDREKDKKGRIIKTPVAAFAEANGLKLYQFDKVSGADGIAAVKNLKPDIVVTAAYGQLLSQEFLDIPSVGTLNIHASLLPKYRGSSPIQSAILSGETETGVTVMRTVLKMDAGDILLQKRLRIDENDTCGTLTNKLSELGAEAIVEALAVLESGDAEFTPQNENNVTYTKKVTKADGLIDFSASADEIMRRIRAFDPWPTAYAILGGDNIKIYEARRVFTDQITADVVSKTGICAGTVVCASEKSGLVVACGDGCIELTQVQAPGKKRLPSREFLRGYKIETGERFTDGR